MSLFEQEMVAAFERVTLNPGHAVHVELNGRRVVIIDEAEFNRLVTMAGQVDIPLDSVGGAS